MDPIRLKHPLVLLCEGAADQNFFRRLIERRTGYPPFNFLEPRDHHGVTAFGSMLRAIQGDQKGFSRLRGVLILADSAGNPQATFRRICRQVRCAGAFPVPTAPRVTAPPDPGANPGMPAVCIMLLPTDAQPGGLETLCVEVLLKRYPWAQDCVKSYLRCGQSGAGNWPAEKLDKARYHCLVAAIHRDDPSRAVSNAFGRSDGDRRPALIDVTDSVFDEIAQRVRDFCAAVQGA